MIITGIKLVLIRAIVRMNDSIYFLFLGNPVPDILADCGEGSGDCSPRKLNVFCLKFLVQGFVSIEKLIEARQLKITD